jgi:ribosomal protein S27E
VSNNRKAREDYDEPVRCADCGTETGPFVMDTADHDIICTDCLIALKGEYEVLYDQANDNAVNLYGEVSGDGHWLSVRCVNCAEEVDYFNLWNDEDTAYMEAAALLEADKEHQCDAEDEEESE